MDVLWSAGKEIGADPEDGDERERDRGGGQEGRQRYLMKRVNEGVTRLMNSFCGYYSHEGKNGR